MLQWLERPLQIAAESRQDFELSGGTKTIFLR